MVRSGSLELHPFRSCLCLGVGAHHSDFEDVYVEPSIQGTNFPPTLRSLACRGRCLPMQPGPEQVSCSSFGVGTLHGAPIGLQENEEARPHLGGASIVLGHVRDVRRMPRSEVSQL